MDLAIVLRGRSRLNDPLPRGSSLDSNPLAWPFFQIQMAYWSRSWLPGIEQNCNCRPTVEEFATAITQLSHRNHTARFAVRQPRTSIPLRPSTKTGENHSPFAMRLLTFSLACRRGASRCLVTRNRRKLLPLFPHRRPTFLLPNVALQDNFLAGPWQDQDTPCLRSWGLAD